MTNNPSGNIKNIDNGFVKIIMPPSELIDFSNNKTEF